METKIYNSYSEFLSREDKKENGVSTKFATENPNFKEDNLSNESCWNCRSCRSCSSCSYCSYCSSCSYCRSCRSCSDIKKEDMAISDTKAFIVPVIENIHQKVLEAVTPPEQTLDMSTWHTCGTTHCRAGWVVHLAGEPGYLLEKQTSTAFAAMQIYKQSSPIHVPPTRFFGTNEDAFKDIERCAKEEIGS